MRASYVIYAKDVGGSDGGVVPPRFEFSVLQQQGNRRGKLILPKGGTSIMLNPLAQRRKQTHTLSRLTFEVRDVTKFCASARQNGRIFGSRHNANDYDFTNAKDPAGHPIQASHRLYHADTRPNNSTG